ncbi:MULTISPECIES: hypothetical protein [unclassified Pseudomonas]|uniref:hypothetical protein n=1 Tax=unclassified Pseudomonas TaxID=196821 RepID=UPI0021C6AFC4|nr:MULTISPECIES: hypothetical protein [unclassified Pseudomonas]MCU1733483.1 hypothetical protein [Pseudomonas sp. 20P_3.2_Bac4]MCU1744313.1 hypothetical protein [Pseudomonas sp. 20P_3.2_Bac5]
MPNDLSQSEAAQWFALFELGNIPHDSTFSVVLSNEPIEYWFYKRNSLRPESVKLELTVPSWGHWRVQLERNDNLYLAQWRSNDDMRIDSAQLRYRKLIKWPRLASIMDFPQWVERLEQSLDVRFLRHANIGARGVESSTLANNPHLRHWLAPCAETFGWNWKKQPL